MKRNFEMVNVYTRAIERIAFAFSEFDNVLIAFSGGKDSGVMLNLCYDYAKENGLLKKLSVYHLDYEAQYRMTTEYVTRTFERLTDVRRFWLCLPVGAQCSVNMTSPRWIPWKKEDKSIWCREMPEYPFVINEENCPFKIKVGKDDYSVQTDFCKYFSNTYGKTAVMIGIRTSESLNRWRALNSEKRMYQGKRYTTQVEKDLFNFYPIFDWQTSDVWVANCRFKYDYNRLYDLFYKAGLSIDQMRVASPFNDCAAWALKFYKVIEPETWGKLVSRVNGVNFAGLYGGTTAMGWKSITKPAGHTWKSYCYFLINTMDEKSKQHYLKILETSIRFWKEKGGAVSADTIKELSAVAGVNNKGTVCKTSRKEVITFDEYPDDIPEVTNFQEIPSYKRMCVCIMKNDYFCKYMGFAPTKEAFKKRKAVIEKYKGF